MTSLPNIHQPTQQRVSLPSKAVGIVFISGVNLILIQWILVRELTALLLGTELVILVVSVAYFAGLSVGYVLSGRVQRRSLLIWGALTLVLHLSFPIWFRYLVAGLASVGAYGAAFFLLPLITPFLISAFYSIFLPRFADQATHSLPTLYSVELLGSIAGIALLTLPGTGNVQVVFAVYLLNFLVLLVLLQVSPLLLLGLISIGTVWIAAFPSLNSTSNARWYESIHGLAQGTITLFSSYSAYQKVDIMQEPDGTLHLYLDGLSHFDSASGQRVNVMLGWIPQRLIHPETSLVVGGGVMRTEQMLAWNQAAVTTVELDPVVIAASLTYFGDINQMTTLPYRQIVIDDAKSFLANSDVRYTYVAGDVPAAYSVQTAVLHTQTFFSLVRGHLVEAGVFGTNLTSQFAADDPVSRRIAAGLLSTFNDVVIVTPSSVGWSFAYASDHLPFTLSDLNDALIASGETIYSIYDRAAVEQIVGDAQPLTLDSLDLVITVSVNWITQRWSW